MAQSSTSGFAIARGAVKVVALLVGFAGCMVSSMALVGGITPNGWARFGVALVASIVVPAVITDRLLPDDDPKKAKGLPGDVFALTWLGFTVAFVVGLGALSRPMLAREGDRLERSGLALPAKLAWLLGGYRPEITRIEGPEPAPGASGSSGGAETTSAPSASADPEPIDAGTSVTDAGTRVADAGTTKKKKEEGELTPAELFKKLSPAVVTVSIKAPDVEGGGTGFLIDRNGTIVTNHHVVGPAHDVTIRFINGATYDDVELLADDAAQDLALLRVALRKPKEGEAPKVEPVELGDSDGVQVGERVIAIGNPLGLEHTLTDGLVSQRRLYEGRQWIQMSVPISPGNSGGPLFDMKGRVVGVTTARFGGLLAQNLNLAVPANALESLIKPDYPGRRKFGKGSASSTW